MSVAHVLPLRPERLRLELEAQRSGLLPEEPERLLIRCGEAGAAEEGGAWSALAPAYQLSCPAAAVGEGEMREAVDFALGPLGVREIIVVDETRRRLVPDDGCGGALTSSRGLSLMERVQAARTNARSALAAAEAEVRAAVWRLREAVAPSAVEIVGVVHVSESGVLRVYDANRDVYEPLV